MKALFSTLTNETIIGIVNLSVPHIENFPTLAGEFSPLEYEIVVDKNNVLTVSFNSSTEVMISSLNPFYLCVKCNGDRFNVPIPPNHKVVMEEIAPESIISRKFTHVVKVISID
jgi:hypothetical protein